MDDAFHKWTGNSGRRWHPDRITPLVFYLLFLWNIQAGAFYEDDVSSGLRRNLSLGLNPVSRARSLEKSLTSNLDQDQKLVNLNAQKNVSNSNHQRSPLRETTKKSALFPQETEAHEAASNSSPQEQPGINENKGDVNGTIIDINSRNFYLPETHSSTILDHLLTGSDVDFYVDLSKKDIKIRKCCESFEYMNTDHNLCTDGNTRDHFVSFVMGILINPTDSEVSLKPGLVVCSGQMPDISSVDGTSHMITQDGFLVDLHRNLIFNATNYCLEQMGGDAESAVLVAATCPVEYDLPSVVKCCPYSVHMNESFICDMESNRTYYDHDLTEAFTGEGIEFHIHDLDLFLCEAVPLQLNELEVYLDDVGILCHKQSGKCFEHHSYCVEQVWNNISATYEPVAAVCLRDGFRKCCHLSMVLQSKTNHTCVEFSRTSPLMSQILGNHLPYLSTEERSLSLIYLGEPDGEEYTWRIHSNGSLVIENHRTKEWISASQYCVEDILTGHDILTPVAFVDKREIENFVYLDIVNFPNRIGKCCRKGYHLQDSVYSPECVTTSEELTIAKINSILEMENLLYTSFPSCNGSWKLHYYALGESIDDYVIIQDDYSAIIYSLENGCLDNTRKVSKLEYCIDNLQKNDSGNLVPNMYVCIPKRFNFYDGGLMFTYRSVIMSISCLLLFLTLLLLLTMRVRRGIVTVKKISTLAGKIQTSYVLANLVAFVAMVTAIELEVTDGFPGCSAMAAALLYFLLSAFFWNSSICFESLILTKRVKVPEKRRFIWHSLWAWGGPLVITGLALLADFLRANVACDLLVAPRFGRDRCFFSVRAPEAQLLYLQLPIGLTIVVNVLSLLTARLLRRRQLENLEFGAKASSANRGSVFGKSRKSVKEGSSNNRNASQSTGMRTHRSKNTLQEGIRLVMWSAGLWFFEILGTVMAHYVPVVTSSVQTYFWLIPTTINGLKGVGIFLILVFTPENKSRIVRVASSLQSKVATSIGGSSKGIIPPVGLSTIHRRSFSLNEPGRKKSDGTVITTVSSFKGFKFDDVPRSKMAPGYERSISEILRRTSISSSKFSVRSGASSDLSPTRNISSQSLGVLSLPSLSEEDDHEVSYETNV